MSGLDLMHSESNQNWESFGGPLAISSSYCILECHDVRSTAAIAYIHIPEVQPLKLT